MDTDISTLLKKGLTGAETAKLIIGDTLRGAKGEKPLLSQKEIKTLYGALIDSREIAICNSYHDLKNTSSRCFSLFNMMSQIER